MEARQGKERAGKSVQYSDGRRMPFEEAQADVLTTVGIWMEQLPGLPEPSVERVAPNQFETAAYYVREFEPNDTPRALVEMRAKLPRRNDKLIPEVESDKRRLVKMLPEFEDDELAW